MLHAGTTIAHRRPCPPRCSDLGTSLLVTYTFGSLDSKVNLVSFHHMYNCKKIVTVCCSGLKSTTSYTVIDWFIYIGGLEGNVLSYGTSIWHNLSPIWFSSHGLTIDWPLQWNIKTKDHNKVYSKNGDDEKADGIRSFQEFHNFKNVWLNYDWEGMYTLCTLYVEVAWDWIPSKKICFSWA